MLATVLVFQTPKGVERDFVYDKNLVRPHIDQALTKTDEVLVSYKSAMYVCKGSRVLRVKQHPLSRFIV